MASSGSSADICLNGRKLLCLGDATLPQDAMNMRSVRALIASDSEIINAKVQGCVGDGLTDDTTAMQTAFTAAKGKVLYIPAGRYKLTATLNVVHSGIHIVGAGIGLTELRWASNATSNGISLSANSSNQFHYVSDMTISTAKDSGTGIIFDYSDEIVPFGALLLTLDRVAPRWTAERLYFAGAGLLDAGDPTQPCWGNCIYSIAALYAEATDVTMVCKGTPAGSNLRGTTGYNGIAFVGDPPSGSGNGALDQNGHPTVLYVTRCNANFAGTALIAINVEGVFCHNCNFIFGDFGCVVRSESGYNHPQANFSFCHINNFLEDIRIEGQQHVNIQGCLLYISQDSTAGVCVDIVSGLNPIIQGNQFESYGTSGSIGIVSNGVDGVISNNIFRQQGTHMDYGIVLTASSSGNKGSNNVFSGAMHVGNISNAGSGNTVT